MGWETPAKRPAEEISSVAEACNVLRARASVARGLIHGGRVDWERAVNVTSWVAKDGDGDDFGLDRAREGYTMNNKSTFGVTAQDEFLIGACGGGGVDSSGHDGSTCGYGGAIFGAGIINNGLRGCSWNGRRQSSRERYSHRSKSTLSSPCSVEELHRSARLARLELRSGCCKSRGKEQDGSDEVLDEHGWLVVRVRLETWKLETGLNISSPVLPCFIAE